MNENIDDQSLLKLLKNQYNDRRVVLYYTKKARDAANRARTQAAANNPLGVADNIGDIVSAINMIYQVVSDDTSEIDEK